MSSGGRGTPAPGGAAEEQGTGLARDTGFGAENVNGENQERLWQKEHRTDDKGTEPGGAVLGLQPPRGINGGAPCRAQEGGKRQRTLTSVRRPAALGPGRHSVPQ